MIEVIHKIYVWSILSKNILCTKWRILERFSTCLIINIFFEEVQEFSRIENDLHENHHDFVWTIFFVRNSRKYNIFFFKCNMSFFTFHLFFFKSSSNYAFTMIVWAAWVILFWANWSDFYKIFKTMRNSIDDFVKLIFLETIFSIVFVETTFSVSSTTKQNVFLNFSCCFLISNDLNSNRTWKILVCIANTSSSVDKILVLMIRLTYAYEAMFSMFSSRTKSFSMFILFAVFEFEENWLFFFIENKTNDNLLSFLRFSNKSCSALYAWT
jgi:hypothetical protein